MARYIVDSQIDNHEKYYFIREQESQGYSITALQVSNA